MTKAIKALQKLGAKSLSCVIRDFSSNYLRFFLAFIPLILVLVLVFDPGKPAHHTLIQSQESLTLSLLPTASSNPVDKNYQSGELFLSPVYEAETTFELLGLHWKQELPEATSAYLEIRFREGQNNWGEWEEIHPDDHGDSGEDGQWSYTLTEGANAFQYRANLSTLDSRVTPKLADIEFDAISADRPKAIYQVSRLIFSEEEGVVSRRTWGANENLRLASNFGQSSSTSEEELDDTEEPEFEDQRIREVVKKDAQGREYWWPLEYAENVSKIVIHHTATSTNLNNPEAAIRAIYQYHTITRSWGDIGYNYIIAPDGRVFEGRAGGDGVVGAHAAPYNTGSIGISLLGNYQDQELPAPMMESLLKLIYEKAELNGINIDESSSFRGENLPNFLAHQDLKATACPGENVMQQFDEVQDLVAAAQESSGKGKNGSYAYEDHLEREVISLLPGQSKTVTISLKNTGTNAWSSTTGLTQNLTPLDDEVVRLTKDSSKMVSKMKESQVLPGGTATFDVKLNAQYQGGLAYLNLVPVFDGSKKASEGIPLGIFVEESNLSFQIASSDLPRTIKKGVATTVTLKLKNTGNLTWTSQGDSALQLVQEGKSKLSSASLLASLQESKVAPGGTGTFKFVIQSTTAQTTEKLKFNLQMSQLDLKSKAPAELTVKTTNSTSTTTPTTNTGTSKGSMSVVRTSAMDADPGSVITNWIELENKTGRTLRTGQDPALSLAFEGSDFTVDSIQVFGPIIQNGKTFKIRFRLTYPQKAGSYTLKFWPMEGTKRIGSSALSVPVTVTALPNFKAVKLENPIRIKLTPEAEIEAPIITSNQTFALYDGESLLHSFRANTKVKATPDGDKMRVTSGSSSWTLAGPARFVSQKDATINVLSLEQRPAWNLELNDNQFRGVIEVREINDETVLINELSFEDYLAGVAEVPDGEPLEKKKAMAIIIRSYALYYLTQAEKYPGMPYNLDDSPESSQKYLGYGFESRSDWDDILQATENQILTYKSKIIKPPYFTQTDGTKTKSAQSVWGWKDTPWLTSVSDSYCKATSFAGHGVGLSGCGARGMAEAGKNFEEILKHYYPGTSISTYDFRD